MRRATLFALATTFICCFGHRCACGRGPRTPSFRGAFPSERLPSKRLPQAACPRSSARQAVRQHPRKLATEAREALHPPAAPALILTTLLLSAALHRRRFLCINSAVPFHLPYRR